MTANAQRRADYLTPKELASVLRVHRSTIYRAIRRGELPVTRLTGRGAIRVHRSALTAKEKP